MEINKDTVLQAWKSEEYRQSLPDDARKAIPARPTSEGGAALTDEELEQAAGGFTPVVALAGLSAGESLALGGGAGAAFAGGLASGLSD